MPSYKVTNKDGVSLNITGEKPPTQEQLDEIFSKYNQQKIETAPVQETLPDQIKLTEETVKKNPRWIEASKSIYKWNEGNNAVDLKTDQDYAEYGLNYMGRFNYNLPQMTVEANQLKDATDKQKKDFITLMDMYDKKSASWAGAGRLFKGLATDPTTYIGATTLGVGTAGAQAVKQAIKEGVKQGTKAGLKQGAKIGSLEGAVYSTADNYGRVKLGATLQQKEMGLATIAIVKSRLGRDGVIFENCKFDNGTLEIDTETTQTFLGFEEEKTNRNREKIARALQRRQQVINKNN